MRRFSVDYYFWPPTYFYIPPSTPGKYKLLSNLSLLLFQLDSMGFVKCNTGLYLRREMPVLNLSSAEFRWLKSKCQSLIMFAAWTSWTNYILLIRLPNTSLIRDPAKQCFHTFIISSTFVKRKVGKLCLSIMILLVSS